MRTKTKKKKRITIKKMLKLLEILVKIGIIALSIYAIVNRLQDVNGLDFFFTTWRN